MSDNEVQTTQNSKTASLVLDNQSFDHIMKFSEMMAGGKSTLPNHLKGNASDCAAIVIQSMQWGMNPFAVAQKTFLINGTIGYEAQLVNSIVTSLAPIKNRLQYEWYGDWTKVVGKFREVQSKKTDEAGQPKTFKVPNWNANDEEGLGVKVYATFEGETEPRVLDLLLSQARTRNSTMWADDPKQQLAYLAVKKWARLYCPDVILGVYTADELEQAEPKIVNPTTEMPQAKPVEGEVEEKKSEDQAEPEQQQADLVDEASYVQVLSPPMLKHIREKGIATHDVTESEVCDYFEVEKLEDIPASEFQHVKDFIKDPAGLSQAKAQQAES